MNSYGQEKSELPPPVTLSQLRLLPSTAAPSRLQTSEQKHAVEFKRQVAGECSRRCLVNDKGGPKMSAGE